MNDPDPSPQLPPHPGWRGSAVAEPLLTVLVLASLLYTLVRVTGIHGSVPAGIAALTPLPELVAVAAAAATTARGRHPVVMVAAGAACWLLLAVPWVAVLAAYGLGLRPLATRRRTAAVAACALAALAARTLMPDPLYLPALNTALWTITAGALPFTIGLWLAARRTLLDNLRRQIVRTQKIHEGEVAAARTAERARIAGEMHDVVAHRVSLMVLHAGALEVTATDPAVTAPAALVRENGREALQELRTILGLLHARDDIALAPQPTLERLDDLIRSSRQTGARIRLTIEGNPHELPVTIERTAYRIVQEALTNIHKHAPRARTTILLHHRVGALDISIRNGRSTERVTADFPRGGHGLLGMGERVALLDGTFTARAQHDGGFLVTATLPTTHAAPRARGAAA
ncbi:sensor histidine kinase [Streptomyces sp. NPDC098789]|uniref:sensor histidine kinase n=1 Tax=Streptomyces sp. NPDC098789 TaxID=3366098 RepID=UPI0038187F65